MASVSRRTDRPGWVVRWRDEAKRQHKRTFRRKLDADRFRAQIEHELHTGAYIDPRLGRQTFRTYAEQWHASRPVRPSTAGRHRIALDLHTYPVFGDRPIASIRPSEVQGWVASLARRGLAPGTVRVVYGTVRAVFRAAVRDRVIPVDPCDRVQLPGEPRAQLDPLTVDQVEALTAAMPPQLQAVVIVAAGTGLRRGELLGLKVQDVDFLRREIRVERQRARSGGGKLVVGPLKNQASYRTVPVGDTVLTALAEHCRRWPPGDGFLFPVGSLVVLDKPWRRARVAAGVPWARFHDLRHFYASALIRAGLSVKVVAARLGHASPTITLSVYSHLWPDDADRTRGAIDAVFRAPQMRPARGV